MNWQGVLPAITTPFREDLSIDHDFLAKHAKWMIDNGCAGIVALGSLGEGATLEFDEKIAVLQTLVRALRAPVVAAISALSTDVAVRLAKQAEKAGCSGLMVLPPYVYSTDWREMKAHVSAVIRATNLSCMLYNNPIAYKTDFLPEQLAELAEEHENLEAVKESAADIRRVTALRSLLGRRLALFVGVDDLIVEGVAAGAVGWIAGLVNAMPKESVMLFNGGEEIYSWFLPLLRMDTVPKFVQLIKLVQQEVGMGSERVRPPRLILAGEERASALRTIRDALKTRPKL
ncbi:MAG TPA: dihydrodipicolinate synthase family protein [Thermoanaerobaculia bacterium]|nr:dihydrodipicolinate synthase family protein [Thermoanaerobaculia bacterium]